MLFSSALAECIPPANGLIKFSLDYQCFTHSKGATIYLVVPFFVVYCILFINSILFVCTSFQLVLYRQLSCHLKEMIFLSTPLLWVYLIEIF